MTNDDLAAIRSRIDDPPDGWDFLADADDLLAEVELLAAENNRLAIENETLTGDCMYLVVTNGEIGEQLVDALAEVDRLTEEVDRLASIIYAIGGETT